MSKAEHPCIEEAKLKKTRRYFPNIKKSNNLCQSCRLKPAISTKKTRDGLNIKLCKECLEKWK